LNKISLSSYFFNLTDADVETRRFSCFLRDADDDGGNGGSGVAYTGFSRGGCGGGGVGVVSIKLDGSSKKRSVSTDRKGDEALLCRAASGRTHVSYFRIAVSPSALRSPPLSGGRAVVFPTPAITLRIDDVRVRDAWVRACKQAHIPFVPWQE
jgi:hypothetical protein